MLHSNGQCNCSKVETGATVDVRNTSKKVRKRLTQSEWELLQFIKLHDTVELIKSLNRVHNLLLYHSNLSIGEGEKEVLFDVWLLSQKLEAMA